MTTTIQTSPAETGADITRFNALRHGVLSRYTVLPWESADEYRAVVEGLVAEHGPQGPTEEHLVEEIAGILWRKRRLRLNVVSTRDLAREVNLPEDRQESCLGDYSNASWSWERALKPYLRAPNQERAKYQIIYSKPEGSFDIFERAFRMTGIMERVAERLSDLYVWRKPFSIEAQTCGSPGASWSVPEHKMILCYELAEEFVQLYKLNGEEPLATLSPPAGGGSGAPMGFR